MKNQLLFIFGILIMCCSSNIIAAKNVLTGSRAANCMQAFDRFLKKGSLLSEDLKKAWLEHPEKLKNLSSHILSLLYYISQRPDPKTVDKIVEKLMDGSALIDDLIIAAQEIACYGEATIAENALAILPSEPTRDPYRIEFSFHIVYKPALEEIHNAIQNIGQAMEWSPDKIKEEKKIFDQNIINFFYHNMEKGYDISIPSNMWKERVQKLQKEHESTRNILTKKLEDTKEELAKEVTLRSNQLNELEKVKKDLEAQKELYIKLAKSKPPLISTKTAVLSSIGLAGIIGLLSYNIR